MKKIGFIGTGVMGSSMVKHLLNVGYPVTVYNRTKEKAQAVIDAGATWADSPKEVASQSDVVLTIVGYPTDVEEVYFGEQENFSASSAIFFAKEGVLVVKSISTIPSCNP